MNGHNEIAERLESIARRWDHRHHVEEPHLSIRAAAMADGVRDRQQGDLIRPLREGEIGLLAYGNMKYEMGILMGLRYAYEYGFPEWVKDLAE